jgi:hypothetical protein
LTDLPVRWKIVQASSIKQATVNESKPHCGSAFQFIRAIDYTVIFVGDMATMRHFYKDMIGFPRLRVLSQGWIEYRLGSTPWRWPSRAELQQTLQRPTAAPRFGSHSRFPPREWISAPTNSCGRVSVCLHRQPTSYLDIARCSSVIPMEFTGGDCGHLGRALVRTRQFVWVQVC